MSAEGISFIPVTDLNDGSDPVSMELEYWAQSLDSLVREPAMYHWLLAVNPPTVLQGYGRGALSSVATLQQECRRMATAQRTAAPGLRAHLITEVSEPTVLAMGRAGKLIGRGAIDHEVTLNRAPSSTLGRLAARAAKGLSRVELPGRNAANISVALDPGVEDFSYKLQTSVHTLCISAPPDTTLWHIAPTPYLRSEENYTKAFESNGFEERAAGRFYYGGATLEEWGVPESVLFVRPASSHL